MIKRFVFIASFIPLLLLSACLYPKSELAKNEMPNEQQLEMVQQAVDQYREDTNGLVPIKTKESDVDPYEKYLIDFVRLKEEQYLSETPGTAYENGGIYQYVIIRPEEDATVKLIDLRITEKLREVYVKLDMYRSKNLYPPFGEQIADGLYQLNYEKLNYKSEPYVVSPFTGNNLPFFIDEDGQLYVDYRIDLQQALEDFDHSFSDGDDIRVLLEDNYPFVPVYSLPYTVEQGEPVFILQ
ncbi:MAG TPA: DUF3939 domain-containing protein [Pseudogracilibacillus sp.]|nr:DUF3939 domain-containing protein [Pseudogracilibacillus sp.]